MTQVLAFAEVDLPGPRLDVFTGLLALLTINIVVLSLGNAAAVIACAVVVALALTSIGAGRVAVKYLIFFAVAQGVFWCCTVLPPGLLTGIAGAMGFWGSRFATAIAAGWYVLRTVTPGDLLAACYRARLPRQLTIPMTVMLRFLPRARREFIAINEAMMLRGIPVGPNAWFRHPLRTIEYIMVPMLVSCSRLADDLTASGMIRGLGSNARPTPLRTSRFGWFDAIALLVLVGIVVLAIWGPR